MPHNALWACHTANSKPRLCATRNSRSRTSDGPVFGILLVYASKEIGLLVVFVARNSAVSLTSCNECPERRKGHIHDIFWMPVHHGVLEIKAFQVTDRGRFDLFRKVEETTELRYFGNIEADKKELFIWGQEGYS